LDDIFAIQDEISAAIVGAMRKHILGEAPKLTITQTTDMQAFDLFLKGKQLLDRRGRNNVLKGHELLEQAISIDPNYAPALAGLAEAIILMTSKTTGYGDVSKDAALTKSKELLDRAVAIAPHSAEVHATLAQYFNLANDVERAAKHIDIALQSNPNYAPAYGRQHFSRIYMGNPHLNSIASLRRALELDPASIPSLFNLGYRLGDRLDRAGVENVIEILVKIDDRPGARLMLATDMANHRGDIAESLQMSREGTEIAEAGTSFAGIAEESLCILRMHPQGMIIDSSVCVASYLCGEDKDAILGSAARFAGEEDTDYAGFPVFQVLLDGWGANEAQAKAVMEANFKVDGWGPLFMLDLVAVVPPTLAHLRRKAGDEAGAQLVIAKLKEYYKVEDQDPDGHHVAFDLLGAAIAMLDGDKDLTFERLEKQLARVWYVLHTVRADRLYEPLHDDPRYDALNAAVDARFEQELAKVREMGLLPYEAWLNRSEETDAIPVSD